MKFLIFGFSVTGDPNGYVERWQEKHAHTRPEYTIYKVGLGGVQPDHARHLFSILIETYKPDAVIIEFATASYRNRPSSDFRRSDQRATLLSLFQICNEKSIKCGLLDLPLQGVDSEDDWVLETDREYCVKFGVPLVELELDQGILTDNVHPNDIGKSIYASALLSVMDKVATSNPNFSAVPKVLRFEAFPVRSLGVAGGYFREFSRHGFHASVLALPEKEEVVVRLPQAVALTGLFTIMNPTSGTINVQTVQQTEDIPSYDMFSYYERIIGRTLHKSIVSELKLTQSPVVPDVVLRKGEKDFSSRVGGVTHVLYCPLS